MKKTLSGSFLGAFLLIAILVAPAVPASAGGFSTAGLLVQDPDLPTVVVIYLRGGFTSQDASEISATLMEGFGSAGLLGIDTTDAMVFSRTDLVQFGLGDADTLDGALRGAGLLYISISGNAVTDGAIGAAYRFDVEVPALMEGVLASLILPASLVEGSGLDLSGLGF